LLALRGRNAVEIHHIRYFLAVCKTLNFTRAAENCNVTQPALSRAIQQLEEEVGGLLFRRERNLTHLTDLGLLMKPRFQQIMDGLTEVKRDARRFLTLEQANLTLGIMCTVGPCRFTGLLADFAQRYSGVTLRLVEGTPTELTERIELGELDLAIMANPTGFSDRHEAQLLYPERFLVAFPEGHRFARMNGVPMRETQGEDYLRRLNCEYWDQLSKIAEECQADSPTAFASEREDWIQNMVAGGFGLCFIPEFSAVIPGIQTRLLVDPEVSRNVCLVWIAGRRHSPAVAAFVKLAKAHPWPDSRHAGTQERAESVPAA
jgi:LysR family transcriptional regulator, hydrogen peroxide-inducible genes activator